MAAGKDESAIYKLNQWKESLQTQSIKLLSETFPDHMRKIEKILQLPKFRLEQYERYTRATALYNFGCCGEVRSMRRCSEFCKTFCNFRKSVLVCREKTKLSRWIVFLIPKMETGDNLGVVTQEAALSLVDQIIDSINAILKWIFEYRAQRSNSSDLECYQLTLQEEKKEGILNFDRAEVESLIVSLKGLIYSFAYLHDFVKKNMEQITIPRCSTSQLNDVYNHLVPVDVDALEPGARLIQMLKYIPLMD
ncbi:Proteasome activator pa28 beta subunit family pro tein [Trichuris trichiura]|uniref:Proteasome activator pa28 beta subunit family pro tein n=1 Tax=Trichuris trichiura TaxID=36087 RepID=A0A077ZE03_TRITR|nr:Proteasome activator pa28 beta subunit family pro tein [Trichuris trichiura]